MLNASKEKLLYQMFLDLDDFCTAYERHIQSKALPSECDQRKVPTTVLALSEILTILCFYHYSGYKCFQYYYEELILRDLHEYFPRAVSYNRFIELIPRAAIPLYLFTQLRSLQARRTGIYFADSKKLPVCDNRRIHSNRVFQGVAKRGKTSTGWFYGLKLHLIINNLGEIVHFVFTTANVNDNTKSVLDHLLKDLKGKCFADKGYLSKFFAYFYDKGIHLVTKIRKNMKNALMGISDKLWLRRRAVIESLNDLLMTVFDIDHTRHRSPWNALVHALAGLGAYSYYPEKPAVFIQPLVG